jgi:hypothetical protein
VSAAHLCAGDPETLDLLDQMTAGKQGERTDLVYKVHEVEETKEERPAGNLRQRSLRHRCKAHPDFHEKVVKKESTAHAAMNRRGS